jgi:UDP-2,3-diacylglucosamine pyrophosphatase LpxH
MDEQEKACFQFTRAAIDAHFQRGIDVVICGHTHEEDEFSTGPHRFFSLADWEDTAGPYLLYRSGQFARRVFSPGGDKA